MTDVPELASLSRRQIRSLLGRFRQQPDILEEAGTSCYEQGHARRVGKFRTAHCVRSRSELCHVGLLVSGSPAIIFNVLGLL